MEASSLLGLADSATASLCATTAARRRRCPECRRSATFLSCACSSARGPATKSWVFIKSVDRVLRAVKSSVPRVNGWNGDGHGRWTAAQEESSVLEAIEDEYGGMVVDADRLPSDTGGFARSLAASSSRVLCQQIALKFHLCQVLYGSNLLLQGKKGVWLKLPLDRSEFIPLAVKQGFRYHHAEESYLMLTYWIPDEPCLLPANASHQVGVGGFVINNQMEVLVVQEKYSASTSLGAWKLPTGFIHASEEIFTGAVREVKEETGVDTEFMELIAFRHAHNVAFQKSDLFFICVLRPLSNEIRIDETEIQAAKWMPLPEFMEQPFIQEDHMFRKISDICVQRLRRRYCGLTAHHVVSRFDGGAPPCTTTSPSPTTETRDATPPDGLLGSASASVSHG